MTEGNPHFNRSLGLDACLSRNMHPFDFGTRETEWDVGEVVSSSQARDNDPSAGRHSQSLLCETALGPQVNL